MASSSITTVLLRPITVAASSTVVLSLTSCRLSRSPVARKQSSLRAAQAKKALLRPLDIPNPDPYYAQLEQELLTAINALGIGPQGFGGRTTALAVHMLSMPTHIAGLPVAVNINCHVARHRTEVL